jgi:hypothetical protein
MNLTKNSGAGSNLLKIKKRIVIDIPPPYSPHKKGRAVVGNIFIVEGIF